MGIEDIKFKTGDRIIVCNKLETVVIRVQYVKLFEEYRYWFKDELGIEYNEVEGSIKLL